MGYKNIKIDTERIQNEKSKFKLNKNKIINDLVLGTLLLGTGAVTTDVIRNHDIPNQTIQEQQIDEDLRMKIEVENTDFINDHSVIIIVDENNVIVTYIKVYPDGTMDSNDIALYPNRDYKMLLKYNDGKQVVDFHIDDYNNNDYTMNIDYATGLVNVNQNENTKTK